MSALAVTPAQAVVLDFESLAVNDSATHYHGNIYTEDGFEIATSDAFGTYGNLSPFYPGSTALWSNSVGGSNGASLYRVGFGTFTLSSIDIADLYLSGIPGTVYFRGYTDFSLSNFVDQSFTLSSPNSLQTFTFSNFNNVVRVNWSGIGGFPAQFDNIVVSATPTTSVPEPFTIIGTLIGGTAAIRMRKKLKQADK